MLIHRFVTPELAQVAYAVGDAGAGEVAIIDPRRDVDEYLAWAHAQQLRIAAVLETHVHADFVSGAIELASATGAPIYTSRLGNQSFDHTPVDDGFTLPLGSVRLTAVHTPGHTPEHIAWRAEDTSTPNAPAVLFSGDALFVGDVGRPDLLGASRTDELVDRLFETVSTVLKAMPDDMIVYPGHMGGSACGKQIGSAPHTTIGMEKATNYAFRPTTRDTFAAAVMGGMPAPPAYYPVLKQVNARGATPLAELPDMLPMSVDAVEDAMAGDAMVIDTRSPELFAAGHIPGSISVGAGNSFSTWLGWLAPYDRDIVLIADNAQQARATRTMLHRIGLDRVPGYHVGITAWQESGRPLATAPLVTAAQVSSELAADQAPTILDVRGPGEYEMGHIDAATSHELARLARGEMPALDRDTAIVTVCQSGYRSSVAASLLQQNGFTNVRNLAGGMEAWQASTTTAASIA